MSSENRTDDAGTQAQGTEGQRHDEQRHDEPRGSEGASGEFLTKDDLAAFKNSMFADMRRMIEGITKKRDDNPPKGTPSDTEREPPKGPDARDIITKRDALQDALADYSGLTRAQLQRVRKSFDTEDPDPRDVEGWVKEYLSAFGVSPSSGGDDNQKDDKSVKNEPNPRPKSDGGAPSKASGIDSDTEAWRLSKDEVARLVRQKGYAGAGAILRERLKRDMRDRRFYIGPDR